MTDQRYSYEKINVVKVIVENPEGKVLLVQEPETNEWMPGHWGLPGGKPLAKESLYKAFKRKTQEELGQDLEPIGFFRIEELLLTKRTVLTFIAVVKVDSETKPVGDIKSYKWVGTEEIEAMDISEFTEFFNKKLLLDYLAGSRQTFDFDVVEPLQFYDLSDDPEFKKWWESGRKDVQET
jgi:ADP-ribose pyrophosphatase YjhB (NUDIX family)